METCRKIDELNSSNVDAYVVKKGGHIPGSKEPVNEWMSALFL